MAYVIYNKESTLIHRVFRNGHWQSARYETEAAAKAGLTRAVKKGELTREDWAIAESSDFHTNIEKLVTKTNLLTGTEFTQPVNTPRSCDPSTELYWTM